MAMDTEAFKERAVAPPRTNTADIENLRAAAPPEDDGPLDAAELSAAVAAATADDGADLLVVILVGCVGSGKSATANRLTRASLESRRSAASVTRACGVAGGPGVLCLDTPGFGDPALPTNALVATIRGALEDVEGAALAATGRAPKFATLYVCSAAARVGAADVAAWDALRFALGRAWRLNALCVWTHADLLDHGLDDFLDGLEDGLREELDNFAGGPALLDNLGSGAREDALIADLVERARRFAGPRPRPRGKHARRIRQETARTREARRRREAGEIPLHAADDDEGRCVIL